MTETSYADYVNKLTVSLFGLHFHTRIFLYNHTVNVVRKSQGISNFLRAIGYEKRQCIMSIPEWIWNNDLELKAFIRGIFDTDGSIALKKNHGRYLYYPVVAIALKDDVLVHRIAAWTTQQGIPNHYAVRFVKNRRGGAPHRQGVLQINGYTNVTTWMNLIGTSNKKHKEKWERRDLNSCALRLQRSALPG